MSGNSSVGNRAVYEAGDQVNKPDSQIEQEKKENRFHEGKENSHKALDSSMSLLCFLLLWCMCRRPAQGFGQNQT